jgi:hypothetical protein
MTNNRRTNNWKPETDEDAEELRLQRVARGFALERAATRPKERLVRTNALRRRMEAKGEELTARDEQVLRGFEEGTLFFDALAAHFHGRC